MGFLEGSHGFSEGNIAYCIFSLELRDPHWRIKGSEKS